MRRRHTRRPRLAEAETKEEKRRQTEARSSAGRDAQRERERDAEREKERESRARAMKAKMLELVLRSHLKERTTPAVAVNLESDLHEHANGHSKRRASSDSVA